MLNIHKNLIINSEYFEIQNNDFIFFNYFVNNFVENSLLDIIKIKKIIFFDVETTGFDPINNFPFLLTLGYILFNPESKNLNLDFQKKFKIIQIFIPQMSLELTGLTLFLKLIKNFNFIITFNGKSFDINFLKKRLILKRFREGIYLFDRFIHIDLMLLLKKIYLPESGRYKLINIEKELISKVRKDDLSSNLIPDFYWIIARNYHKYGYEGLKSYIEPILSHNFHDVKSLFQISIEIGKRIYESRLQNFKIDKLKKLFKELKNDTGIRKINDYLQRG